MSQQRILVTGAAGFIGYHLIEKLLAGDVQVVGVDNFNDYYDPALKRARQERLLRHTAYTPVEMNIAD
ncbi:MAG: NAD-dependent epimerase/dehydratase family protein, partial [Desulfobulbaceae bacterium]|nr:NAD-dependent epimerase/dehydratase family protein [Desulfobulbaceae bacterium]